MQKFLHDKYADGCVKESALERLWFFCAQAMCGQDWLDVEPFFDDVEKDITNETRYRTALEQIINMPEYAGISMQQLAHNALVLVPSDGERDN